MINIIIINNIKTNFFTTLQSFKILIDNNCKYIFLFANII